MPNSSETGKFQGKEPKMEVQLTRVEFGVLGLVANGFTNKEIDPLIPLLRKNTAEELMRKDRLIPESWIANGFSYIKKPLTEKDWGKVFKTAFKDVDEKISEDEIREAARAASAYTIEQQERREEGIKFLKTKLDHLSHSTDPTIIQIMSDVQKRLEKLTEDSKDTKTDE